jgi:hypothetical protein
MKRNIVVEIISCLLVLVFMYAAVSKLLEYQTFQLQLSKSPFITQFAGIIAWALPISEMLVALALTFKNSRLFGLYASLFMMTIFTTYIFTMLTFSYDLPCSCGGILSKMSWRDHFWFNVVFTILPIIAILLKVTASNYKENKQQGYQVVYS